MQMAYKGDHAGDRQARAMHSKNIFTFLVPMGVTIESIGVYYSEFSLALFCVHQ